MSDPTCRRHTVPLLRYGWDEGTPLYRCPVGHEGVDLN